MSNNIFDDNPIIDEQVHLSRIVQYDNKVYQTSRIDPGKTVSKEEFIRKYADNARGVKVRNRKTGKISHTTAHAWGTDAWWLVDARPAGSENSGSNGSEGWV